LETDIYIVDAFTRVLFRGNPAAVCPLQSWLEDDTMQLVALENNLSETAFFVQEGPGCSIRWFTPETEVELCGHATLAASHVIFTELGWQKDKILFQSASGPLCVQRERDLLAMDFPAQPPAPAAPPAGLLEGLGGSPVEVLRSKDYLVVYGDEEEVRSLEPRMDLLKGLDLRGVIVTAPGRGCDFVSRFFAPALAIDEDPVTGSAHCALVPYWSRRLGKRELHAFQVSRRTGELFCRDEGRRVIISGRAVTYLRGRATLP
jgi:predicted PhzF superfamily epimerase YddE/YHI9